MIRDYYAEEVYTLGINSSVLESFFIKEVTMITRRQFLKYSAAAGAAMTLPWGCGGSNGPRNIRKFITSLPGLGPTGANEIGQYLPLATKTTQMFAGISTDVY